jgi:hypothetical protein
LPDHDLSRQLSPIARSRLGVAGVDAVEQFPVCAVVQVRIVLLEPRREALARTVAWLNAFLTALKGP